MLVKRILSKKSTDERYRRLYIINRIFMLFYLYILGQKGMSTTRNGHAALFAKGNL